MVTQAITPKTKSDPVLIEVSQAEANLIKRIRQMAACRHLVILDKDAAGLVSFSELGEGKVERLGSRPEGDI